MTTFRSSEIRKFQLNHFKEMVQEKLAAELHYFAGSEEQMLAWGTTAEWIFAAIERLEDSHDDLRIIFEHCPPLANERPDIVVVGDDAVLVIEAKTGNSESVAQSKAQVLRYARHLYNYVDVGQKKAIIPVLLRNNAPKKSNFEISDNEPSKSCIIDISPSGLTELLGSISPAQNYESTAPQNWLYNPRPTIIDAARLQFSNTTSENILDSMADDEEITLLLSTCTQLITQAREEKSRIILAVSGVPGAGKTLVGLRLANDENIRDLTSGDDTSAPLYLSGNGPLVEVLTEALARDERARTGCTVTVAREVAMARIRLIHGLTTDKFAVKTHVLVFDEAQRAWDENRMRTKLQRRDLGSESEEILRRMESVDWSVVVCLIGTGQQINDGEKGMLTWTNAVESRLRSGSNWTIYGDRKIAAADRANIDVIVDTPSLNLKVVRRANNASVLGDWVAAILDNNLNLAQNLRSEFRDFPIFITRNLQDAKTWLRRPQKGRYETFGLLASSRSARLSTYGVDAQASAGSSFDWTQWFLDTPPNLNSALTLEVAATEFKCQGLELDETCVCWSWDLVHDKNGWKTRKIRKNNGTWQRNDKKREYAINTYRVLLTRAREGMVIWVPEGDERDPSRNVLEIDRTYEYLVDAGCTPLQYIEHAGPT